MKDELHDQHERDGADGGLEGFRNGAFSEREKKNRHVQNDIEHQAFRACCDKIY